MRKTLTYAEYDKKEAKLKKQGWKVIEVRMDSKTVILEKKPRTLQLLDKAIKTLSKENTAEEYEQTISDLCAVYNRLNELRLKSKKPGFYTQNPIHVVNELLGVNT